MIYTGESPLARSKLGGSKSIPEKPELTLHKADEAQTSRRQKRPDKFPVAAVLHSGQESESHHEEKAGRVASHFPVNLSFGIHGGSMAILWPSGFGAHAPPKRVMRGIGWRRSRNDRDERHHPHLIVPGHQIRIASQSHTFLRTSIVQAVFVLTVESVNW